MPPCFYVSLGFEHYKCCGHHVMWGVFMIKRDVFGYLPYDHIESLSLEKGFKNNTLKWQAKIQSKKKSCTLQTSLSRDSLSNSLQSIKYFRWNLYITLKHKAMCRKIASMLYAVSLST